MNFAQAVAEVLETTKRPDLIGRIRREVNSSISFYCLDSEFPRDFSEQEITLNPNEYAQTFALSEMTRFRKFKYLRRAAKYFLSPVSTEDIAKACYTGDKYYIAGSIVNIAMRALSPTLSVGFYSYPPLLTDSSEPFWLLEQSPYMVIDRTCASIFKSIGDEKSFQTHRADAADQYLSFRKDIFKTGT